MNQDADFRTWNIFRRRHDGDLCCAVSAEAPVPSFLMSGEWDFGFQFTDGDPPVAGFCASDADAGFGGFYLFLSFSAASPGRH